MAGGSGHARLHYRNEKLTDHYEVTQVLQYPYLLRQAFVCLYQFKLVTAKVVVLGLYW